MTLHFHQLCVDISSVLSTLAVQVNILGIQTFTLLFFFFQVLSHHAQGRAQARKGGVLHKEEDEDGKSGIRIKIFNTYGMIL